MSGTSALNLASRHPGFYQAVASYSGYPTVTMPGFNQGIQASVIEMGGNPVNMWGVWPAGQWAANDPFLSANNLAGHHVYVSSGTGVGSKYDTSVNPSSANFDPVKFAQMVPLEVAASTSSQLYIGRLAVVPGVKLTTHITQRLRQHLHVRTLLPHGHDFLLGVPVHGEGGRVRAVRSADRSMAIDP